MAQAQRQSELFAGESWQVLYQAFTQINFNASDPASINAALQNYIQVNYPEDFNDWIASSEFIAIIDLLSWLAGNLAFKTDISVRENFLETAEARSSILRLARFLSYNPSRNLAGQGILKLVEIMTDDTGITDSSGTVLANLPISWNNPDDANWYERFTTVLNAAFVSTNPFGVPLNSGTVGGIATQLYRINALFQSNNWSFSSMVGGTSMNFEVANADFQDQGSLIERSPNPSAASHLYYLNDSNGNASPRTGFFLLFKQGSTQSTTFTINVPVANQLLDVGATSINQTDVWVQTVADTGTVLTDWTQVPVVLNSNITYNTLPVDQRNIFSVITRDQDQISIRFSDGNFGNAPVGNIQVTYRVSNGLQYAIKASEITRISLPIKYVNRVGVSQTLTLTFSLFESVTNAAAQETEQQIAQRAPQVYATQNRMVSGEDYNTFPLSSNLAVKLKAVNRIYSGQSRYFDLNDPTGTYRDLSIFADDGSFYKMPYDGYNELPTSLNLTPFETISNSIQPLLQTPEMANYVNDYLISSVRSGAIAAPTNLIWEQSTSSLYSATGSFNVTNSLVLPGSMLQYQNGVITSWVGVASTSGPINVPPSLGAAGPVTLSLPIANNTTILAILPRFVSTITQSVISAIETSLTKNLSFSLWYDYTAGGAEWSIQGPIVFADNTVSGTMLLLATVDYVPGAWRINAPGLRYVFESLDTVEWYDNGRRAYDSNTGVASQDSITVLKINPDLNVNTGFALKRPYGLAIDQIFSYIDGTIEPTRVTVGLLDANDDGFPDDPDLFYAVTPATLQNSYLFWTSAANSPFQVEYTGMFVYETQAAMNAATAAVGTEAFVIAGTYATQNNTFWTFANTGAWVQDFSGVYSFAIGRGSNVASQWTHADGTLATTVGDELSFQWKHYATSDTRIDPASTNIQDIFVLTYEYDNLVRQWITNGAIISDLPLPPTELDLRLAFAPLEDFRMFSDAIVWRPVSYKFLFGNGALPELAAQFKVVKLLNTTVSDGEIKSQIINAMNVFFEVSKWDFGETFYFTEMAAYVHQQMAGIISSFVIVPLNSASAFGDVFEVTSRVDEIFVSTAQVSDILLISSNTPTNLRIR